MWNKCYVNLLYLQINIHLKFLKTGRVFCDPFGMHKKKIRKDICVVSRNLIHRNLELNLTADKVCSRCWKLLAVTQHLIIATIRWAKQGLTMARVNCCWNKSINKYPHATLQSTHLKMNQGKMYLKVNTKFTFR